MTSGPRTDIPTIDLDYEAHDWLPVPTFDSAEELDEWIGSVIRDANVAAPFDTPPESDSLPELLAGVWGAIADDAAVALWYCPYGLPPAGLVEVRLTPAPERDDPVMAYVDQLPSAIEVYPRPVRTDALGEGLGVSRIVVDGDESWGQIDYVFEVSGCLVVVSSSSGETSVLSMMGADVWDIVESLRVQA